MPKEESVLLRKKILTKTDQQLSEIWIPEWDTKLFCRVMTGRERQRFMSLVFEMTQNENPADAVTKELQLQCMLIALCFCDDDGSRIFLDEDIEELENQSWQVLRRLFEFARMHNKLTDQSVEELEKNSGSSQSDDSGLN